MRSGELTTAWPPSVSAVVCSQRFVAFLIGTKTRSFSPWVVHLGCLFSSPVYALFAGPASWSRCYPDVSTATPREALVLSC